MTNQELLEKIESTKDRLFWLSMADRFTPNESKKYNELNRELLHLLDEKNKRGI